MPPKSDFAHVTQLVALNFLASKSTRADFAVDQTSLQLQIEAHAPGVYRLRCAPASALNPEKPSARARAHAEMLLARQEPVGELAVSSIAEPPASGWRIQQGDTTLELTQSPLQLAVYRGDDCILTSPEGSLTYDSTETLWRLSFDLDGDDALHGTGSTAGELNQRGTVSVSDKPEAPALPMIWSTKGWGLYFNTMARVEHDMGHSDPDLYQASMYGSVFDAFLFVGDPSEILNQYTALTGRAGQPSLWPMGVWLDQAPGQSSDDILAVVQTFRDQQWGLDAVCLGAPAVYGFQADKPVFEWDAARVPDARDLFSRAQALNIQLAAPSFPGVLSDTDMFAEWEDRGWLLIDDDGNAHIFDGNDVTGGKPFGLLDLTHKDVYKLWSERQRQVFDDGLGAPVCDAQFNIPDGITARGGESGAVLRTIYPLLARQALFDAVAGHKTPQEGVVISADLFPSAQRFAWQRGPRTGNDWAAFEHSLRTALSLGDSGVTVQTHTLGSAVHPVEGMSPELYIRWLAANVFSANFSFQALPALLPSAFDAATQELVQHWLQWRYRLVPYVLGIIEDAVRSGLPVQRSMALAFPSDPLAQVWDTQYMLGPALLVAPVLKPGKQVQVYLPEGDAWWDLNTGWRYEGGTTWTVEAGLDTLPLFGREGHMLCLGPTAQHTGDFNSARILDEVWMFGMPEHSPVVMRNKIRVMQMQGSSYIKGLEGLRILPSEGLEVKRRGAEVRISRAR
ncbi:glycoside hydrolase family 31 protein [Pollutimonas harenae]|uniref:Glycoside hydrolase family 31 protein n=1 Tax=Pollutimonas harenae TaxID=657015 RepID=A0A853GVW1_9BURK|nr:glycoside hydrolase family 31 protein [Pollutimonas harenae]NYT86277.1 glycoside hydrolase family 31 protein [Pollutimonas harenae]TEA69962.1 glycoside hydrolase family 31 protein [Pollutimonas harenae]